MQINEKEKISNKYEQNNAKYKAKSREDHRKLLEQEKIIENLQIKLKKLEREKIQHKDLEQKMKNKEVTTKMYEGMLEEMGKQNGKLEAVITDKD